MTPHFLARVRCWIPGPTRARVYADTLAQNRALRESLVRSRSRHETIRTLAYHWQALVKAGETAATDAGFDDQTAATVIYTLAAQLETARAERDEALRAFRVHVEGGET